MNSLFSFTLLHIFTFVRPDLGKSESCTDILTTANVKSVVLSEQRHTPPFDQVVGCWATVTDRLKLWIVCRLSFTDDLATEVDKHTNRMDPCRNRRVIEDGNNGRDGRSVLSSLKC